MENKISSESFVEISNRGRVAYAICCLENAMEHYKEKSKGWDFVLENLWTFCNQNMAIWQERTSELRPETVCEHVPFELKDYGYLSEKIHDDLKVLYAQSNTVLLRLVDEIYALGAVNIFVTISSIELAKKSLPYLQGIIDIMTQNNITLPNFNNFLQFPIDENKGWGREFTREEVFK
ncbi:MAG: hypothetical protein IT236_08870 [Bacteroidia bacterium]|nr:hypothetical protein [Bacteroidia bacterium]